MFERFPVQVVTAWPGNTPEIARRHHLQVTESHFQQAAMGRGALQPALRQSAESTLNAPQEAISEGEMQRGGDFRKANSCQGLRGPAAPGAAVVSPYDLRENGEDRILWSPACCDLPESGNCF
jgi:hypothetical protein